MNLDGWNIEFYNAPVECEKENLLMVLNANENIVPNIGDVFWHDGNGYEVVRRHLDYENKIVSVNSQ